MGHVKKTNHNRKREKSTSPIVPTKIVKSIVEGIAQLVKLTRVPLRYPYIIYSSSQHHVLDCPKKTKVQNMFWTKPNTTTTIGAKNLKFDNVPINVVGGVMTHNQA